jgi:hypothetical protein
MWSSVRCRCRFAPSYTSFSSVRLTLSIINTSVRGHSNQNKFLNLTLSFPLSSSLFFPLSLTFTLSHSFSFLSLSPSPSLPPPSA